MVVGLKEKEGIVTKRLVVSVKKKGVVTLVS